jgi:putative hydrolase of the HAD superfamily
MINGVAFDLGETLLHFEGDWPDLFSRSRRDLHQYLTDTGLQLPFESFSETLRQRIEQAQEDRLDDHIERPVRDVLEEVLAQFGHQAADPEVVTRGLEVLFALSEAHWRPVAGMADVLNWVKARGWRMGIISNASDEANVQRLVAKIDGAHAFDPVLVSARVGVRKPAPEIFNQLIGQWALPPETLVMVGDTLDADILGAQSAGMHQIWLRSAQDRADNQAAMGRISPEAVAIDLRQVPDLLERIDSEAG